MLRHSSKSLYSVKASLFLIWKMCTQQNRIRTDWNSKTRILNKQRNNFICFKEAVCVTLLFPPNIRSKIGKKEEEEEKTKDEKHITGDNFSVLTLRPTGIHISISPHQSCGLWTNSSSVTRNLTVSSLINNKVPGIELWWAWKPGIKLVWWPEEKKNPSCYLLSEYTNITSTHRSPYAKPYLFIYSYH